jgi:hypothetical protein
VCREPEHYRSRLKRAAERGLSARTSVLALLAAIPENRLTATALAEP